MSIIKGLDGLKQRMNAADEARKNREQKDIELVLKDGDIAKLRFITDAQDVVTGLLHTVPMVGLHGKPYSKDVYCKGRDNGCEYCNVEDKGVAKLKAKSFYWVYVYEVLRKVAKPGLAEVEHYGEKRYKEVVNDFMIIRTGEGFNGYIAKKFMLYHSKYNTLCDRDYEWMREGVGVNDTTYELMECGTPAPLPNAIVIKSKDLQKLDEYVAGVGAAEKQTGAAPTTEPKKKSLLERIREEKEAAQNKK